MRRFFKNRASESSKNDAYFLMAQAKEHVKAGRPITRPHLDNLFNAVRITGRASDRVFYASTRRLYERQQAEAREIAEEVSETPAD